MYAGKSTPVLEMSTAAIMTLMMEAVSPPETSVNFYQPTWHDIPK
jgi:hypothetical protein